MQRSACARLRLPRRARRPCPGPVPLAHRLPQGEGRPTHDEPPGFRRSESPVGSGRDEVPRVWQACPSRHRKQFVPRGQGCPPRTIREWRQGNTNGKGAVKGKGVLEGVDSGALLTYNNKKKTQKP